MILRVKNLLAQILTNQNLQQLIAVNFADESAGIVMVSNIGGVFGEDISNDLVDGIIALFLQCPVNCGEDMMNFSILIHCNAELSGKIVHKDTTFLSLGML